MAMMNEMEYRTIGKALAGGYRAAVYCRLSKDDDLQGESASIANQRDMLEKYCFASSLTLQQCRTFQVSEGFFNLHSLRIDINKLFGCSNFNR